MVIVIVKSNTKYRGTIERRLVLENYFEVLFPDSNFCSSSSFFSAFNHKTVNTVQVAYRYLIL